MHASAPRRGICPYAHRRLCICVCFTRLLTSIVAEEVHEIQRVRYQDLTFALFGLEFRTRDRPLIITHVPKEQQPCFGPSGPRIDELLRQCSGSVRLMPQGDSAVDRKSCGPPNKTDFTEFMELFAKVGGLQTHYQTDKPFFADDAPDLVKNCGGLWNDVRIPAYFTGMAYAVSPNFYFAQKGMKQQFHQDFLPAELWTSICRGKKKYRIVPISVAWMQLGRDRDLTRFCLRPEDAPMGLHIWEGILNPGEVLWLGAGSLHSVINLEDTISIVQDFIDAGNLTQESWLNVELMKSKMKELYLEVGDLKQGYPVYDRLGVVQ